MIFPKPIDKTNVSNINHLTPLQEGILFHYLKSPNGSEYFEQLSLQIRGSIHVGLFNEAWQYITNANEMLRTIYRWEGLNKPIQITLKSHDLDFRYYDLSKDSQLEREHAYQDILLADKIEHFNLEEVPFRITLCKITEQEYKVIISNYHILYDGWSNNILLNEFMSTYEALVNGSNINKKNKGKYKQYIQLLEKQNKEAQKKYWTDKMRDFEKGKMIPNASFYEGKKHTYDGINDKYSEKLTAKIKEFCRINKLTQASLFYAAWSVLLSRYYNNNTVTFGTTVSGRDENIHEVENIVGLFINTLPRLVNVDHNLSFLELAKTISVDILDGKDYELTPLVDIKDYIGSHEELFETIVVVENYPLDVGRLKGKSISIESYSMYENTNYDITLAISGDKELEIAFSYKMNYFTENMIENMSKHFKKIIEEILNDAHQLICSVNILTEKEKKILLCQFNQKTNMTYDIKGTIQRCFERRVNEMPEEMAVHYAEQRLTYRELNNKANQLAYKLRTKGINRESVVGLLIEPSIEMVIGMLGVLKAGGAYLPIDTRYPVERIHYMLDDSQTTLVLSQKKFDGKVSFKGEMLHLDEQSIYHGTEENLEEVNTTKDLAYVIYTSGTTGNPKGVMIEHKNVVNLSEWYNKKYNIAVNKNVMQITNISFDVSVLETVVTLMNGGRVFIPKQEDVFDKVKFKEFADKHQINMVQFVPATLNELVAENKYMDSLSVLICGGERLPNELKNKVLSKGYHLYNHYGPTETTVDAIVTKCTAEDVIGKPVQNCQVYILNDSQSLQPIGVVGELYIGGEGIARGYLNNEELTREKFVMNPFNPEEKLYKTGDLGRWLPDGNIEYLGRMDNQIKIRGNRIEIGEIEMQLLSHPDIKEAVVIVQEDESEKYLCGYFLSDKELTVKSLREYLAKKISQHMIPVYMMQLDYIPLMANGKIDREKLSQISSKGFNEKRDIVEPGNEIERKVFDIWSNVLGREGISISDDFYVLGGNSLKMIRIYTLLNKEFPEKVLVQDLFDNRTIESIARLIEDKLGIIENGEDQKIYNITF